MRRRSSRFSPPPPNRAYTPTEVHEATDLPGGCVGVVRSRQGDRGLVGHRGEYWAVAADAAVETTLDSMRTARAASDRFGPEDPDEWGPGVEDDEG